MREAESAVLGDWRAGWRAYDVHGVGDQSDEQHGDGDDPDQWASGVHCDRRTRSPTGKVYVVCKDSQVMTVIETDTDTVNTTIPLQGYRRERADDAAVRDSVSSNCQLELERQPHRGCGPFVAEISDRKLTLDRNWRASCRP